MFDIKNYSSWLPYGVVCVIIGLAVPSIQVFLDTVHFMNQTVVAVATIIR